MARRKKTTDLPPPKWWPSHIPYEGDAEAVAALDAPEVKEAIWREAKEIFSHLEGEFLCPFHWIAKGQERSCLTPDTRCPTGGHP